MWGRPRGQLAQRTDGRNTFPLLARDMRIMDEKTSPWQPLGMDPISAAWAACFSKGETNFGWFGGLCFPFRANIQSNQLIPISEGRQTDRTLQKLGCGGQTVPHPSFHITVISLWTVRTFVKCPNNNKRENKVPVVELLGQYNVFNENKTSALGKCISCYSGHWLTKEASLSCCRKCLIPHVFNGHHFHGFPSGHLAAKLSEVLVFHSELMTLLIFTLYSFTK